MSEFIGARISLISKSNISSEDSTVSLENVTSFGTEDRKTGDEFIAPSEQVYEYIVFRGSDVKDLRIEDAPVPKPMPPAMPNDPAILGARPRPINNNVPPQYQQGPPQGIPPQGGPGFNPNMPMPPGAGGWGPNGPDPRNFPYPPPAGWYPPQGPGFGPGGPGGPGGPQWNNNFYPPGPPFAPGPPGPNRPSQAGPDIGQPSGPQELEPKSLGQPPSAPVNKPAPAGPGVEKKAAQPAASFATAPAPAPAPAPSQAPAPLAKRGPAPSSPATAAPVPSAGGEDASLMAATAAAKAAVASAMSKVNATPQQAPGPRSGAAPPVDNLTQKFNEMRVNAVQPHHNGNNQYAPRGRGRGGNYGTGPRRANPVPVPTTAFDFEASNQKFNKDDLVKEVIASGDADATAPAVHSGAESEAGSAGAGGDAETADAPVAYNKTRSFFDNISSEAKDRAAVGSGGQKPGNREWRGEEQRRNMETFGQGSVDGNYRGYRGRGRGRGRGYGRGRGGGGYRQNNNYNSGNSYQPNTQ